MGRYERLKRRRESSTTTEDEPGPSKCANLDFEHFDFLNNQAVDETTQTEPDTRDCLILQLKNKVTQLTAELNSKGINKLKKTKKKMFSYFDVKDDPKLLNFYTGLSSKELFQWILSLIKNENITLSPKLVAEEQLFLVLVKLRLGLLHTDIAYRVGLKICDISTIYRQLVVVLAKVLEPLIIWPERDAVQKNIPTVFRKFKNCNCIIDCTEIFIERSFNLNARAQTWSNYKNTNTIKYLVGISPAGAITFLSQGWGGKVSDKEITIKSGFLDKLEHGDCILADRGFTVANEIATKGAILKIPNFTRGKSQMTGKEIDESREIANVRIHVERVIGRMRKFRILQSIIPITQVDLTNNVMVCICGLVNLNRSVVPNK